MNIKSTIETLLRDGFILVFNQDKLDVVKTAQALVEAGINNMEVTCRIKQPLEKISRMRKELPNFATGAASLIDSPQMLELYNKAHPEDPLPSLTQVVAAGACYLVSAINFSNAGFEKFAGKIPMIPGCGSATEIVSQFSNSAARPLLRPSTRRSIRLSASYPRAGRIPATFRTTSMWAF